MLTSDITSTKNINLNPNTDNRSQRLFEVLGFLNLIK